MIWHQIFWMYVINCVLINSRKYSSLTFSVNCFWEVIKTSIKEILCNNFGYLKNRLQRTYSHYSKEIEIDKTDNNEINSNFRLGFNTLIFCSCIVIVFNGFDKLWVECTFLSLFWFEIFNDPMWHEHCFVSKDSHVGSLNLCLEQTRSTDIVLYHFKQCSQRKLTNG